MPGVDFEHDIKMADKFLLEKAQIWNPALTQAEVKQGMDSAADAVMKEVAAQYTRGGKGTLEQSR